MSSFTVCALYKFVRLENFEALKPDLLDLMLTLNVRGTILLAHEGINGTISGAQAAVDQVLAHLNADARLNPIDCKFSYHDNLPFLRTKVKLKKEIVTMGCENIDPNRSVGTYVEPKDWNSLISDHNVLLIDTRNDYECEIGSFKNAINPETESFREFPTYASEHLDPDKHKKIAMFCTGGIRCEKSTAYLKEQGFEEVYHLKGGVLKYLEEIPEEESLWEGECFVFDDRVAVDHQLEKGSYDQCHACRYPITEEDKTHLHYQRGVSCHRCFDKLSDQQKQRFAEREKQMQLAQERGEQHLGVEAVKTTLTRREIKLSNRAKQRDQSK